MELLLTDNQKHILQNAKNNHFITQILGESDTPEVIAYRRWCKETHLPQVTIIYGKKNKLWAHCEVSLYNDTYFDLDGSIQFIDIIHHITINCAKVSKHACDEQRWNIWEDKIYIEGSPITNAEIIARSMYDISIDHMITYKKYSDQKRKIIEAIKARKSLYDNKEYIDRTREEINHTRVISGLKPINIYPIDKERKLLMDRWNKITLIKKYEETFSESEILAITEIIGIDAYNDILDTLVSRTPSKKLSRQDIEDRITGKY